MTDQIVVGWLCLVDPNRKCWLPIRVVEATMYGLDELALLDRDLLLRCEYDYTCAIRL